MSRSTFKIAVVAPGRRLTIETARWIEATLADSAHAEDLSLVIHPQCFLSAGHFAGTDAQRAGALTEVLFDPSVDAVWFARGGYGAGRVARLLPNTLSVQPTNKLIMGYSDGGYLLAHFHRRGLGQCVHGPMPNDVLREGGPDALRRCFAYFAGAAKGSSAGPTPPSLAYNLTVLAHLIGTQDAPEFAGRVLHLEDVGEYAYRTDRAMIQLSQADGFEHLAGVRIGRFTDIPENDIDFGETPDAIVRHWCRQAGVPVLDPSGIAHDADNSIVPFG